MTNEVDDVASIVCPMSLRRRGVETRLVLTNEIARARSPDAALIDLVARAHGYLDDLTSGRCSTLTEVAAANHTPLSEVSRILPLTFLSPKIVEAIVAGTPTDRTHRAAAVPTLGPLAIMDRSGSSPRLLTLAPPPAP